MAAYKAPVRDIRFVIHEVLNFEDHYNKLGVEDVDASMIDAFLEEGAKFSMNELDAIYRSGDEEGCKFDNGTVTTPKGFKEAFAQYVEGGWNGLAADPAYGGQGLPHSLGLLIGEMVGASNTSWGMYPGLTHGAMSAIHARWASSERWVNTDSAYSASNEAAAAGSGG